MEIKSLEELQRPDDRLLYFSPRRQAADIEDAVRYHQELIDQLTLAEPVPEHVRMTFERLQTAYVYGALCYELYGLVYDQARLTLEYALRERFMAHHAGTVSFVDRAGNPQKLKVASFEELFELLHENYRERLRKQRWQLVVGNGVQLYFDAMLDSLLRWARAERLLFGQVNRRHEDLLKRMRNRAAHTASYKLVPPDNAVMALADLAEIINRLWGVDAPGGRLYPTPVRRTAVAVAWSQDGDLTYVIAADQLGSLPLPERDQLSNFILVRGSRDDELFNFDALYEGMRTPAEWLWGPGSRRDAMAWLEQHQPDDDEVELLDRLFVARFHDSRLYLPQHPDVAAALDPCGQAGTWYLTKADSPIEVFNHLRQALAGGYECRWAPGKPCPACPVDMISAGPWSQIADDLAALGARMQPRSVPDVRVPGGWPRWNVIEDGGWSIPPGQW